LRGWYAAGGHAETPKSLSKQGGGGDFSAPLYTFQEVNDMRLGDKLNAADSYTVVATINLIRVENSVYKACPVDGCKKKVSYVRNRHI
jgi:replication factor A1